MLDCIFAHLGRCWSEVRYAPLNFRQNEPLSSVCQSKVEMEIGNSNRYLEHIQEVLS